jgi:hypothetical protein
MARFGIPTIPAGGASGIRSTSSGVILSSIALSPTTDFPGSLSSLRTILTSGLGVPNQNNRVYTREVWEKAIADFKGRPAPIATHGDVVTDALIEGKAIAPEKILGHVTEMEIGEHGLIKDGDKLIPVLAVSGLVDIGEKLAEGIRTGTLFLRPSGSGNVDKDADGHHVVSNYVLEGFVITNDPA